MKIAWPLNAKIWEVACGREQQIVKYLQSAGFTSVTYSDLQGKSIGVTKHNFLEAGEGLYNSQEYDLIITTPPSSKCEAFIQKAIELGRPFNFLVKLDILGTVSMGNLVINSKYNFFGFPVQALENSKLWLIGLPSTAENSRDLVLKYFPQPQPEQSLPDNQVVEEIQCEEVSILDGVGYCANFLQTMDIDPTALLNEIVDGKAEFFQPRDVNYMKYRGNPLKRTKAFVYDGDSDHIPVYTYPVRKITFMFVN